MNSFSTLRLCLAFPFVGLAFHTPLYAEEEKQAETNVAVSVGKVTRTTLHAYVIGYGSVGTAPTGGTEKPGGARLASAAAGLVVSVPFTEGARVEKGAILVQLDA